jgi:nucleoside-diphosphate-sugar epimerase
MRDLATTVLDLMGNPIEPQFGALPERPTEVPRLAGDATKATKLLCWAPTVELEDGLRWTIDWYAAELAADRQSSFAL